MVASKCFFLRDPPSVQSKKLPKVVQFGAGAPQSVVAMQTAVARPVLGQ